MDHNTISVLGISYFGIGICKAFISSVYHLVRLSSKRITTIFGNQSCTKLLCNSRKWEHLVESAIRDVP